MNPNKILVYINLLTKLIDAMLDEHIASFRTNDAKDSKFHIEKRGILSGMLLGTTKKIVEELHA